MMPDSKPTPPAPPNTQEAYDPSALESTWYAYWEESGFFGTRSDRPNPPHVVMMPPPNVTGRLHMGHALQDTIQDALTRLRRMQGFEALWMPGKDHAGIATQNVVERTLKAEEGLTRHDLGRDAFIDRVWDWVGEYGDIILQQKRKLGDSCDWDRERFTLDDRYARAVQDVFVRLYEDGLIYRGDYLVNWDPENQTALSDEEVDNVERDGSLWYVRYPLSDGSGYLMIATTRPETMLGDTAIAVHPEDERYTHLVGKTVVVPLVGREIPIIADDYVKMEFGAGAVKITPGHDKNDFEMGKRHDLPVINMMRPDATVHPDIGIYAGLDRFEARKAVVQDLEAQGYLERTEDHKIMVPISSRSKEVIEPLISRQWFVRMEPLAKEAIRVVKDGEVTFYPRRWENEYFRWLENIRDWCISRQLWWGHRIPVWYHADADGQRDESRDFIVSVEQPAPGMIQDEDVLDTWFSSWLWPFATLGWPSEDAQTKADLDKFFPSQVLVSGYDILFFWIARMIMASLHFTGKIPYQDIFITGMIKDKQGRWMSKSLGNGIDPLEMIEQYGADAVRFSLTVLCAQGQDIKLDPTKFEMGRNFANKIWNAFNVFGRFIETDDEGRPTRDYRRTRTLAELDLVEQWMVHQFHATLSEIEEDLSRYRLNEAVTKIYGLFWGDYCDWYLELIKPAPGASMEAEPLALAIELYEQLLQLLHPFMPHITEALWWKLRPRAQDEACIRSAWPKVDTNSLNPSAARVFTDIQEMISGIRNAKSRYGVAPGKRVPASVQIQDDAFRSAVISAEAYFVRLARVETLSVVENEQAAGTSVPVVGSRYALYLPMAGLVDLDAERTRLEQEIEQKTNYARSLEGKLQNEQFVSRAPEAVVAKERAKLAETVDELARLQKNLSDLQSN